MEGDAGRVIGGRDWSVKSCMYIVTIMEWASFQTRPLSCRLFPLTTPFPIPLSPSLVTNGGCLITVFCLNILRSGLSSSRGGGGRRGDFLAGGLSGSNTSSSSECRLVAGDDMER